MRVMNEEWIGGYTKVINKEEKLKKGGFDFDDELLEKWKEKGIRRGSLYWCCGWRNFK